MKIFFLFIATFSAMSLTAQINPVNDVTWQQDYDFGYYHYTLQWEEPSTPHDELLGYNIYRDDELYRFQPENYLTTEGINPNGDQDFIQFESNSDGFEVHVTAVYAPDSTESEYVQTIYVENNLLNLNNNHAGGVKIYPNPTSSQLYIVNDASVSIKLYDLTGKNVLISDTSTALDLTDFAKGIYTLELTAADLRKSHHKIIVE